MAPAPALRRFYSLDVLRGAAALCVVFWHWQHFFRPFNTMGAPFVIDHQPFFGAFQMFYRHGDAAVQLFFCLSGFIFFWLYSKPVADRVVSFRSFAVLRLSRLYPLHFVTLVFVAIGQRLYVDMTSTPFVYPFNDTYHFLLNVLFVPAWGFEKGPSFNSPVWSVSVEVLVYVMFFVFCRIFNRNLIAMVIAVGIGYFTRRFNDAIGIGMLGFFIGGIAFVVYGKAVQSGHVRRFSVWLSVITTLAWLAALVASGSTSGFELGGAPWILRKLVSSSEVIALFPLTILTLAFIETRRGTLGRRLSFIGDISYSSYLLHFPLQLAVALIATKCVASPELFYSPWFMVAFFIVLIAVSLASHRYLEVPLQRHLRLRFGPAPHADAVR